MSIRRNAFVGLVIGCFLAVLIAPVRQDTYQQSFFEAFSLGLVFLGPLFVGMLSAPAIGTKDASLRVRLVGVIALALLLSGFVYLLLPVLGAPEMMTLVAVVHGGDQSAHKALPLAGYQFLAGLVAISTLVIGTTSALMPALFLRGVKA